MEKSDDDIIVCRCEDVTLGEIREKIREGLTTTEELKRVLRVGMGPCRGKTCIPIVRRELSRMLSIPIEDVLPPKDRPPVVMVKFKSILEGSEK
ncbi:(2Fe-2S)-binding protein [bacterium]|nr:(2Fe-2S)-binding protein [bacterium]